MNKTQEKVFNLESKLIKRLRKLGIERIMSENAENHLFLDGQIEELEKLISLLEPIIRAK